VFGALWGRATATGAPGGLAIGAVGAIGLTVAPHGIHFLYVAPLLFVASGAAIVVGSLASPPPSAEARPFVWSLALARGDAGARDYRIYAALLLAATLGLVAVWA